MIKKEQINALKKAGIKKRDDAINRVHIALKKMQSDNIPINFQSVAKFANVAKSWLYNHTEIATEIKMLRGQSEKIRRLTNYPAQLEKKNNMLSKLEKRIDQVTLENTELKKQLAVLYGKLYKKNHG